jgi:hypothetical protein
MSRLSIGTFAASGAVAGSFESIATATGTGSSGTITFSSIPQTYKHLHIRCLVKDTNTTEAASPMYIWFNGDTSYTHYNHSIFGRGTGAPIAYNTADTAMYIMSAVITSSSTANNAFAPSIIDIPDYASTVKNKVVRAFSGAPNLGTNNVELRVALSSGLYPKTNAVESITLQSGISNTFTNTSKFALYGIKG